MLPRLPITHYLLPITYYPLPITHYLLPITYYPLPITHYLLPITYYPLPITHYLLPITYYPLPITHYLLPITYYPLPITHYRLPITYYPLPITHAPDNVQMLGICDMLPRGALTFPDILVGHLPSRRWVGGFDWWHHAGAIARKLAQCNILKK
ncbi:hypothetical protein [Moorena producens]|uniref:hypothetical protein n=1 Tax=Moorena producens TaxID=1155739 RepID=UPI000A81284D|nr:hypothetical protein [Moorena producens]